MGWLPHGSIFLVIIAFVWCSRVARTLPDDVRTFRASTEPTEQGVQVIIWAISVLLALSAGGTLVGAVRGLVTALG